MDSLLCALRADRDFMLAAAAKSARGHALHFASHALKADGDFLRAARQALADKHLALPEEQRELLHRLYYQGQTQKQIAEVLFRTGHLDRDEWQVSSARFAVSSLLREGRDLIAGGYRKLLRHQRRL